MLEWMGSKHTKRRQPSSLTCLRPMECCPGRHKHHISTLWRKEKCFLVDFRNGFKKKKNQRKESNIFGMEENREKTTKTKDESSTLKKKKKRQAKESHHREAKEEKISKWLHAITRFKRGNETETTDEKIREERKIKSKERWNSCCRVLWHQLNRMTKGCRILPMFFLFDMHRPIKRYPAGNGLK